MPSPLQHSTANPQLRQQNRRPLSGPQRLRHRAILDGLATLADIELIALVLGSRSRDACASRLLDDAGSLETLTRRSIAELQRFPGLGAATACRLAASLELGRRAQMQASQLPAPQITSLADVERWAGPRLSHLEHEEVWLLCLDANSRLRAARQIARGGQHACALTARDILRPALQQNAAAIVLVHNHPSGDCTPSAEDTAMTQRVQAACVSLGLLLLDHAVVARRGVCSALSPPTSLPDGESQLAA
ncbi:MAG: DNA repair protein RadC [Polyangiaceae bacterium]|nr:DNA repair protein RadC [Polyangiaceae bacterium]